MASELDAEDRLAFAACLAHVLGDLGSPPPRPETDDPLPIWRAWLAERGFAMVDVDSPETFAMPGYWLALMRPPNERPRPVVMFGVPSGAVFDPRGVELPAGEVERGWVLAPLDLRDREFAGEGARRRSAGDRAVLEAIYIAEDREGPMKPLGTASVGAAGIAGDRYARGEGTFTNPNSNGHAVTLIEAEALAETRLPDDSLSSASEMRRNLVTRGIELNELVGRRFKVGEVELVGRRPCEPCAHLQRLTRHGILRAFIHRGGLRADVVSPGTIVVADRITPIDQPSG